MLLPPFHHILQAFHAAFLNTILLWRLLHLWWYLVVASRVRQPGGAIPSPIQEGISSFNCGAQHSSLNLLEMILLFFSSALLWRKYCCNWSLLHEAIYKWSWLCRRLVFNTGQSLKRNLTATLCRVENAVISARNWQFWPFRKLDSNGNITKNLCRIKTCIWLYTW